MALGDANSEDINMGTYRKELDRKREKQGFSLQELATQAAIGTNTLSMIVNGHVEPYQRTVYKLADALRCSPSEIGFDADEGGDAV